MFNKGTKLIDSTIGQFEKIKKNLQKGIEDCKETVAENLEEIKTLTEENSVQNEAIARAEKVVANIEQFFLG